MVDASVSAKIDADTKREIRIAAAKRDMTMSEYVRLALVEQLKRDGEIEGNQPTAQTAD